MDFLNSLLGNKPSEYAKQIMDCLDCKCEYFPKSNNDSNLMSAYKKAVEEGKREGFTPIIITVDRVFAEWLTDIVCEEKPLGQLREELLSQSSEGGKAIIDKLSEQLREDMEEDEEEFPDGEISGGEQWSGFSAYQHFGGKGIEETILAYIPTSKPYEVFAWVPFGGWNECPEASDMIKISRYWYEKYGAVPATISHDILECVVEKPLDKETALAVANEMFAVCPDIVWQGKESIGRLADTLTKSTVWYFWWD